MELPPGFRFHPTDEELITHYLSNKVMDPNFNAIAIGEVDLIKCEPWDLPWKAKMGEKEWYFFCVRDRKYPTGLRTNRATESGYWKATGKDKDIYRSGKKSLSLSLSLSLVGMKKTLVFYRGRAPKGEKTNWVMHEYRLEGKHSVYNLPRTEKNEWVICRVFKKSTSSGGKKGCSSGTMGLQVAGCSSNELEQRRMSLLLPPLMDVNPSKDKDKGIRGTETAEAEAEAAAAEAHVTCFSNIALLGDQKGKGQEEESITISPTLSLVADYFNTSSTTTPLLLSSASSISNYPNKSHHHHHVSPSSIFISNMNISASLENSEQHYVHPNNVSLMQLLQSNVYVNGNIGNEQRSCKADKEMLSNISQETGITADMNPEISSVNSNNEIVNAQEVPSASTASLHLEDCLWSY